MFLYIMIAAVTVCAAAGIRETEYCAKGTRGRAVNRSCLFLVFLVLFIPAALRQETGNDYLRYVEFFHLASIDAYVPTEPGFNAVVKLIYGICGYENYLLVFAVFAALTIAFFLTAIRQQSENFLFSFFLFMMFGYYFQSFNTMRYYLALSIALVSMTCWIRRHYAGFILLVVAASLFHKSALIVLVLYPLASCKWRKWMYAAACIFGAAVLAFHNQVLQVLVDLYPTWEDTGDLAAGTSVSWANVVKCAAVLVLAVGVACQQKTHGTQDVREKSHIGTSGTSEGRTPEDGSLYMVLKDCGFAGRQMRMYIHGSFIGLLFYVFGWFIPEVSRICYYLTFTQIFLLPMLLCRIPDEKNKLRKRLTTLVCIAAVFYFAFFLRNAYGDTIKILPYKTFLFHDLDATPSGSIGIQ